MTASALEQHRHQLFAECLQLNFSH